MIERKNRILTRVLHGIVLFGACVSSLAGAAATKPANQTHNVIIFIADGLRGRIVDARTAPNMAKLKGEGSYFPNSHSVFPTFTTANASTIATGHQLGDTGDFSNGIYVGSPIASAGGTPIPFLENDTVLGEVDQLFDGDYLNEPTLLSAAREAGYSTAAIGKLGPTLIQDHRARDGQSTIIVDDSTGTSEGIPLSGAVEHAFAANGLPLATPPRGANGDAGSATKPGTLVPNQAQLDYFTDAATRVVLPLFKARARPFVMVFWSRDPDGTQHDEGDSLNHLTPGINGPTTMAAIANADGDLGRLRSALERLDLAATTDVFVTSDHGFSVIAKQGTRSPSAASRYGDVPAGFLPPGFLALDLANAMHLPLFDPDRAMAVVPHGSHPSHGNGLLGPDARHPQLVVAANGGSDLLYLPTADRRLARRIISILSRMNYVSGLFADDRLGIIPGALPLSAINLVGRAVTPRPAIVVNFRTFATGCAVPTNCQAEIADTTLQQGQGMHGSFGRGDTLNFMAATGPDFKTGFVDAAPTGNPDIVPTLASVLGLALNGHGAMRGRPIEEALRGRSAMPKIEHRTVMSSPAPNGKRTIVKTQTVDGVRYLDAGGYTGATMGLAIPTPVSR